MSNKVQSKTKQRIIESLSAREIEVIKCMAKGSSRSDIALALSISVLTYDEHRKNIRNKLGLQSSADWALVLIPFM